MPRDAYDLQYAEDTSGFPNPSPTAGSTFQQQPGNVVETKPNGDIINFKPFIAPASAAPKLFDPASVIGPPPTPFDERFATPSEKYAENLKPHQDALNTAREYFKLAETVTNQHNEAKKFTDSADFLTKLSTIERTDPEFERKFAEISAAHPYADGQLVQNTVQSKMTARKAFMDAMQHGGASEFGSEENITPEYHAYKVALHETKDPVQARARALQTKEGEKAIADAVTKGVFNVDEDLPAWQPEWASKADKTRPKVYNRDGSINYNEAQKIIAKKTGAGEGLKATLDLTKNSVAAAEKFLGIHKEEPDATTDPELFKNWHAANSIIVRSMRGGLPNRTVVPPSATPSALPSVTPPPTSASRYTNF